MSAIFFWSCAICCWSLVEEDPVLASGLAGGMPGGDDVVLLGGGDVPVEWLFDVSPPPPFGFSDGPGASFPFPPSAPPVAPFASIVLVFDPMPLVLASSLFTTTARL